MPKRNRLSGKKLSRLESWEKGLLGFGIVALPLVIYPDHPDPTTTKMTVALVWIGALLTLTAIRLFREGRVFWRSWLWLPFGTLFGASLLSLVNSLNLAASLFQVVLFAGYFALTLLVAYHVRRREDVLGVLGLLLVAGSLAAIYGLLQYYGLIPGLSNPRMKGEVMISTFGNKNFLGGYLAYVLIPGLGLLVLAREWWWKALTLGALVIAFAALLGISQDGAWVALVAAGLFTLVGLTWGRLWGVMRQSRPWVVGLLGLFVILFLVQSPPNVLNTIPGVGQEESPSLEEFLTPLAEPFTKESAKIRLLEWWIAWEMFQDHPLLGVGVGDYKLQFLPYKAKLLATGPGDAFFSSISAYVAPAAQAHNDYAQWAAETGSLGVMALLFAIGYLVWMGLRRFFVDPEAERKFQRLIVLAGIGTFAVHAMVDFPLHLPASALTLAAFLGILSSRALAGTPSKETGSSLKQHQVRALAVLLLVIAVTFGVLGVREFAANAHLRRAMFQGAAGDLEGAQQELERSIHLSFAPAHNALLLGAIYSLQGRDAESVSLFRVAVRARPSEMAYLQLGRALLFTGERGEGRKTLQDLLAMAPRSEVAVEAYRLWELSESPWVQDLLVADRWIQMGVYPSAEQVIESLLAQQIDQKARLELWRQKAGLASQRGDLTQARSLLEQALSANPEAERIYLQLAGITLKEEPSEAEKLLRQARELVQKKRESIEAVLAATPPSAERQIQRVQLEFLQQVDGEAERLEEQLSSH